MAETEIAGVRLQDQGANVDVTEEGFWPSPKYVCVLIAPATIAYTVYTLTFLEDCYY